MQSLVCLRGLLLLQDSLLRTFLEHTDKVCCWGLEEVVMACHLLLYIYLFPLAKQSFGFEEHESLREQADR